MLVYGECECFVMQMLCVTVFNDAFCMTCTLVNSSILSNSCLIDFNEGLQMLQIHVKFSNPFNNLYCAIEILLQLIHCHLLHTLSCTVSRQLGLLYNIHKWCPCYYGLYTGNSLSERLVHQSFDCSFECHPDDQACWQLQLYSTKT